jgi:acetyl esterase/lipase
MLLGVPYPAIPGIRPRELDLYRPADALCPVSVVVFLHGGGWRVGSWHSAGPAFDGVRRSPFERLAQRDWRWRAWTTSCR